MATFDIPDHSSSMDHVTGELGPDERLPTILTSNSSPPTSLPTPSNNPIEQVDCGSGDDSHPRVSTETVIVEPAYLGSDQPTIDPAANKNPEIKE